MKHFLPQKLQHLTKEAAVSIFTRENLLSEKDARFVYGMSKMPIGLETKELASKTNSFEKVAATSEFMEMLARAAELKYKEETTLDLAEKIQLLLDRVLTIIGATTVSPSAVEDIHEASQSDEDY